jgi:hypothetical protein
LVSGVAVGVGVGDDGWGLVVAGGGGPVVAESGEAADPAGGGA